MKKILLLLLILAFSVQICSAADDSEEDINSYFNNDSEQSTQINGYLEYNEPAQEIEQDAISLDAKGITHINIAEPKKFGSKSLITNSKKPTFQPINDEFEAASKFSTPEYNIKPVSTTYSRKFGKFSFGTKYGSSLSNASASYSTGIFSRYDGKHFALSSAFSKSTNSNYDSYSDNFSIAPELKLTKRLSFLDVMQTDATQVNRSNEFVLRYVPRIKNHYDDVELELGAGQSFYEDSYIKSSLRFSTRFKL